MIAPKYSFEYSFCGGTYYLRIRAESRDTMLPLCVVYVAWGEFEEFFL